jgi:hypothetical protein
MVEARRYNPEDSHLNMISVFTSLSIAEFKLLRKIIADTGCELLNDTDNKVCAAGGEC